jgi:uncharacterized protein YcbK (DUF882 family)
MMQRCGVATLVGAALIFAGLVAQATELKPFFFSGDNCLYIQSGKNSQRICFRDKGGDINQSGLARINKIFGAHYGDGVQGQNMSLRFLEFLSFLQSHYDRAPFKLLSGFRAPKYNQSLRDKGKLAAQTSMHTEGAAADIIFPSVLSAEIFPYIKSLNCCGVGYYHGNAIHIDTGPPRYWDETTSGTEKKEPQQNEKIIVQSIYDRYHAGDDVVFQLMRVTEYPVEIPVTWELMRVGDDKVFPLSVQAELATPSAKGCKNVPNRVAGRQLLAGLPEDLSAGKYRARLSFCSRTSDKMPASIESNIIEVVK